MKLENNKKVISALGGGLLLILIVTLLVSESNYRVTATSELASGTVKDNSNYDRVAIYINEGDGSYKELDKTSPMPSNGYAINEDKSYCYIGTKDKIDKEAKLYTNSNMEHVISNLIQGDKCILYFDKTYTMEELLANYYTNKRVRTSENKDFNVPFEETTTKTVFSAPDDDGTSYYFAGNPTDNWVEFGEYYWRIIRVNGNGSIRMIYQGRTKDENGNKLEPQATGEETQIGKSTFNEEDDDNAYAGYFYEQNQVHGLKNTSTIYTAMNIWFASSNIKQGSTYFDKIDLNVGFYSDRMPSTINIPTTTNPYNTGNGSGGIGTTTTYYGAYLRLRPSGSNPTASSTTVTPTLNYSNKFDLYTFELASQGNKVLENPVGMITADEAAYAGMVYGVSSSTNYLDTYSHYWTLSPCWYRSSDYARVFLIHSDGYLSGNINGVHSEYGMRPVINLRSDVKLTGLGTSSNPYKVVS
ncbi:MAG: hypothetical protein NC483_01325 [Ruminococcus sp.]|nr:hypothetical protein [Ruminococcus sp.]